MVHDVRSFPAGVSRLVLFTLVLAGAAGCQSKPATSPSASNAWATVNGHAISQADVDLTYRRSGRDQALDETVALADRLGLLDEMIDQEVFLAKARDLKIEVAPSELDTAYADARKNIPDEAYKEGLTKRSLTEADMREALRRELVVQKLFTREVTSKVSVTDQEVAQYFEANKSEFNRTEEAYRIAQILVTPAKEAQVTNRTGSDAATALQAVQKYRMIMDKLKAGAQFGEVAADYSEDPNSAPRRGDLGFIPLSVVQKYPPQLRDAVLTSKPGVAKAVGDANGFVILLVLGKDAPGQKELTTPGVKEAIAQSLKSRREQMLRASYVESLRNAATIENLIARRVVESQGKVPAGVLATPGAK
jgi:peptidyl-prolyl cis-trans isomerase SurA